jgi:hypothetical protein
VNTFSKVGDFAAKLVNCPRCGRVTNGERRVVVASFGGVPQDWRDTPGPHVCISFALKSFLYIVPFVLVAFVLLILIPLK